MGLDHDTVVKATFALNMSVVVQWISLLFIPAMYNILSDDLGFSGEQLGLLLSSRLLAMFCSLPIYAWACYYRPRNEILAISLFCAMMTNLLNIYVRTYASFLIMNILTGFFLAAVVPVGRSLIPIYYPLEVRGRYFGYFELSQGIGGFLGCVIAVMVFTVPQEFLRPWQLVYVVISLTKIPAIILAFAFVKDPILDPELRQEDHKVLVQYFKGLQDEEDHIPSKNDIRRIMTNPMYLMILGQGLGAFPWSGNSFLILWFQRMGLSEDLAIVIFAAVGIGAALGGLIGGIIGDRLSRTDFCGVGEKYGRIMASQFSVAMGLPLSSALLLAIPRDTSYWWVYALTGGVMGLTIAWPPANNSANQSDIFPQKLHPMSFAIQYWFEGTIASFCPFTIGFLNQHVFGGEDLTPPGGQVEWDSFSHARKLNALNAMAKSIVSVDITFWGATMPFFFGMYYFYPRYSRSLNPNCFGD